MVLSKKDPYQNLPDEDAEEMYKAVQRGLRGGEEVGTVERDDDRETKTAPPNASSPPLSAVVVVPSATPKQRERTRRKTPRDGVVVRGCVASSASCAAALSSAVPPDASATARAVAPPPPAPPLPWLGLHLEQQTVMLNEWSAERRKLREENERLRAMLEHAETTIRALETWNEKMTKRMNRGPRKMSTTDEDEEGGAGGDGRSVTSETSTVVAHNQTPNVERLTVLVTEDGRRRLPSGPSEQHQPSGKAKKFLPFKKRNNDVELSPTVARPIGPDSERLIRGGTPPGAPRGRSRTGRDSRGGTVNSSVVRAATAKKTPVTTTVDEGRIVGFGSSGESKKKTRRSVIRVRSLRVRNKSKCKSTHAADATSSDDGNVKAKKGGGEDESIPTLPSSPTSTQASTPPSSPASKEDDNVRSRRRESRRRGTSLERIAEARLVRPPPRPRRISKSLPPSPSRAARRKPSGSEEDEAAAAVATSPVRSPKMLGLGPDGPEWGLVVPSFGNGMSLPSSPRGGVGDGMSAGAGGVRLHSKVRRIRSWTSLSSYGGSSTGSPELEERQWHRQSDEEQDNDESESSINSKEQEEGEDEKEGMGAEEEHAKFKSQDKGRQRQQMLFVTSPKKILLSSSSNRMMTKNGRHGTNGGSNIGNDEYVVDNADGDSVVVSKRQIRIEV